MGNTLKQSKDDLNDNDEHASKGDVQDYIESLLDEIHVTYYGQYDNDYRYRNREEPNITTLRSIIEIKGWSKRSNAMTKLKLYSEYAHQGNLKLKICLYGKPKRRRDMELRYYRELCNNNEIEVFLYETLRRRLNKADSERRKYLIHEYLM